MEDKMQWFRDAKLGIFMHWGIYSVLGVTESWSFFDGSISYEDYMNQLNGFTAENYNPEKWAQLFEKTGAKYTVLTSKHHDGPTRGRLGILHHSKRQLGLQPQRHKLQIPAPAHTYSDRMHRHGRQSSFGYRPQARRYD